MTEELKQAAFAQVIEEIANGWDGCMYDAPGGEIDISAAIRAHGTELLSLIAAQAILATPPQQEAGEDAARIDGGVASVKGKQ